MEVDLVNFKQNDMEVCTEMKEFSNTSDTEINEPVDLNTKPVEANWNVNLNEIPLVEENFDPKDTVEEFSDDLNTIPLQINEENPNSEASAVEFSFPEYQFENPLLLGNVDYPADESQNYIRGCKWSPDGTCLLYAVRGKGMTVVELPIDLYGAKEVSQDRALTQLKPAVAIPENALLYDFCWYPGMRSQDPATCCWLTSCQHAPVQLWDAFTGELRCTYRGYDLVDEVEAALSLQFSYDATKIYCGYKKSLKVFDADKPGREYSFYKINYPVTCIATNTAEPGQLAIGSWHKVIQLLDDRSGTVRELKKLTGHFGGVTHLKFSPDGSCLFSGARKDNELICWDLRSPGRPLFVLTRKVETHQRIYFDISPCGSFVFSGGTDCVVKSWNLLNDEKSEMSLHADCVNSVSLHPYYPILATGSGQHHFFDKDEDIVDVRPIENSIKIWWLGK